MESRVAVRHVWGSCSTVCREECGGAARRGAGVRRMASYQRSITRRVMTESRRREHFSLKTCAAARLKHRESLCLVKDRTPCWREAGLTTKTFPIHLLSDCTRNRRCCDTMNAFSYTLFRKSCRTGRRDMQNHMRKRGDLQTKKLFSEIFECKKTHEKKKKELSLE